MYYLEKIQCITWTTMGIQKMFSTIKAAKSFIKKTRTRNREKIKPWNVLNTKPKENNMVMLTYMIASLVGLYFIAYLLLILRGY